MTDDKAREARYAEAIYLASDPCGCNEPSPWADLSPARQGWFVSVVAPPVMAVADAEVEAATRELRAEVERLREAYDGMHIAGRDQFDRAEKAEAERDQLRAAVEAAIQREGKLHSTWDKRSEMVVPAEALRAALARVGAADTQPEVAGAIEPCPGCRTGGHHTIGGGDATEPRAHDDGGNQ